MSCSREEIERKRLAALQKRQNNTNTFSPLKSCTFSSNSPSSSQFTQFKAGPIKSLPNNSPRSFHPYSRSETNLQNENSVPVGKVVSGTIYLISDERFEVNPSEFCTPLINIFKTLPSRNYDPRTKLWNFSIHDYQELMSKVTPLAPHVVLGSLPNYVLKILREPMMDPNNVDLSPIESTLRNKLMPFQEEGVRFGIAKRGRCMIADDMGLGKTFQALAIASYYRHNWPMLIVTTSSMRETWQSKIHELLPSVPMMNIVCLNTKLDTQLAADRQTEVVICSYKLTAMHTDLLKSKKFGVVVIDESHYLKSHKAQCTLALSAITRTTACRVILLSGTPALSRPAELYTQLDIIEKNFFNGYTEYGKRYCGGKLSTFGWDMSGQSNLTELQVVLQRKFLIRRTKEQVLDRLEDKTRQSVLLDSSLLASSRESREGLSQLADQYQRTSARDRHAALLTYFNESAAVKIPAVRKYLKQFLDSDKATKFLVFAHHKNMIDAICLTLDELGTHYICITGSTPGAARADLVDKFQYHESCRCAVLSITAANSGLTLTAANLVLFAELHWNPGILTQAESRAHRIGQEGGVAVKYLLAAGTSDDFMWPMLQDKLNVLNEVGLSKDSFENTTSTLQESKNGIAQYLGHSQQKNKNDYIPGTNIRKNSLTCDNSRNSNSTEVNMNKSCYSTGLNSNINSNSTRVNMNISSNSTEVIRNINSNSTEVNMNINSKSDSFSNLDGIDKSFFDDDEGDELLANLDL